MGKKSACEPPGVSVFIGASLFGRRRGRMGVEEEVAGAGGVGAGAELVS